MPIDEAAALPEEAPLVEAGADGRERLRRIVVEHHATLWRFLRRMGVAESDVDDAIQEVLLVVMRKLDRIEPGRERAYLLSTGYRVGSRIRAKRAPSSGGAIRDPRPGPEALLDQKRAREMLDRILVAMPEDLRAVFVLHDIERLTMAEIADALELKPGTVASRLRRARGDFDARVARIEAQEKGKGGA